MMTLEVQSRTFKLAVAGGHVVLIMISPLSKSPVFPTAFSSALM